MTVVDVSTLTAAELEELAHLKRESERRWGRVADAWRPTIGAIRARGVMRPVSPMGPIPLDRLRRVARDMAPWAGWSRSEIIARALLELAEETGTDPEGAARAVMIGLRQGRGRWRIR